MSSTSSLLVKNRWPPGSIRQPPSPGVRAKPPTCPVASKMRGVTPLSTSRRAAVSPAGPAPMINGVPFASVIGYRPTQWGVTPILRDEVVDVATRQIVEWRRQEVQHGVLALQRQESAQQGLRSGPDDQVDVTYLQGVADVTALALGAAVRLTQFMARVIGGQHVDPETLTGHELFHVTRGLSISLRKQGPLPMDAHTADGGIEVSGDQRGGRIAPRRRIPQVSSVSARPKFRQTEVVHRDGLNPLSLQCEQNLDHLVRAAKVRVGQRGAVCVRPTPQSVGNHTHMNG